MSTKSISADGLRDFGHAREINDARIGARADNDHFRLVFLREAVEFVVVDGFGIFRDAVSDEVVGLAGKIQRMAVSEMAAVGEIHAENGIAGLQRGHIDGDIGLRAGMRLHIGVIGAEERFGAIDGELLGDVHEFAAAVIALAGIAFGVFIGEHRAHGFHHRFGDAIFRGNQLDAGGLAANFFAQHRGDFRIDFRERQAHAPGFGSFGSRCCRT